MTLKKFKFKTISSIVSIWFQDNLAEASSAAEEAIGNVRTVKSFANEKGEGDVYLEKNKVVYDWGCKRGLFGGGFMAGNIFLSNGLAAATLWYGGHLILNNRISGDTLIPFVLYQINLGNAIGGIGAVYTGLMQETVRIFLSIFLFEYYSMSRYFFLQKC